MVKSPCCGECRVESGLCRGCLRTLDEISRWTAMNEQEQLALLTELPQRATRHSQPGDVQGWVPEDKTELVNAICPQCGEPSGCAVVEGKAAETCWCMQMPRGTIILPQTSCWCARCLAHQRTRSE